MNEEAKLLRRHLRMYRRFLLPGMIGLAAISLFSGLPMAAAQNPSPQPVATTAPTTSALKETHWNLIELDGNPVTAPDQRSQPYLYLHDEGDKLSGSGGCNRLFGSFDLSGDSLQFHSVASTRMACADNSMRYESDLLEALKLATSYTITGNVLALRVDDRILAKFRAEQSN